MSNISLCVKRAVYIRKRALYTHNRVVYVMLQQYVSMTYRVWYVMSKPYTLHIHDRVVYVMPKL